MKKPASSRKKAAKKAPKKTKTVRKPPAKPRAPETFGETCLHKHCQQWLEKSGVWNRLLIFHVPNERKGGIGAIMHFKRMGVRTGVADYLAFSRNGARAAIELKDVDGVQSPEQEAFQTIWEMSGGTYRVVRTLEEFQNAVLAVELFG